MTHYTTSRYLCFAALSAAALFSADAPPPVTVAGVVMDSVGRPLASVWIHHTGILKENIQTDTRGRFEIATRAPAIVFRKSGFKSQYWRVLENRRLTITLAGSVPPMKPCEATSQCAHLTVLVSGFCLPKLSGVNVAKQGDDSDYNQIIFLVKTPDGKQAIQLAAGATWGPGLPSNEDVWSARDYSETSYIDRKGLNILDARGKSADGKCWRMLGHAFETASYRNVPQQDIALLDQVLDGACLVPKAQP
jgi:hypothetical protein